MGEQLYLPSREYQDLNHGLPWIPLRPPYCWWRYHGIPEGRICHVPGHGAAVRDPCRAWCLQIQRQQGAVRVEPHRQLGHARQVCTELLPDREGDASWGGDGVLLGDGPEVRGQDSVLAIACARESWVYCIYLKSSNSNM